PTDAARRPLLRHPAGIVRHYAPLALVKGEGSPVDLRLGFPTLARQSIPLADSAALAEEERAREEEHAAEAAADAPGAGRSQTTAEAEASAGEEDV
ncbi:hypothetical protein P8605_36665, partial [Streptomyces sp. T-3]|nr:hypothetical protein [Streptomyces sp. T-3]